MIPNNRVVAHFLDGRVIKGTTSNFFPNRPTFHLLAVGAGQDTEVQCRQLKAVFFVKDLAGDENRKDIRGFVEGPAAFELGSRGSDGAEGSVLRRCLCLRTVVRMTP